MTQPLCAMHVDIPPQRASFRNGRCCSLRAICCGFSTNSAPNDQPMACDTTGVQSKPGRASPAPNWPGELHPLPLFQDPVLIMWGTDFAISSAGVEEGL